MFPNLGWAQETCQTGPSWLVEDAWVSAREARGGGGGDKPAEGLEETVIVAVDFEDLDGLVGGAGLEAVCVSRTEGEGDGGGGGEDVRRGVCRSSPERSHAGGESVLEEERRRVVGVVGVVGRVFCLHSGGGSRRAGELTIMSSWRFDICVYGGHPRQRSRANTPRRTDLGAAGPEDVPF